MKKGFVSSPVIGKMMMIITIIITMAIILCAATFFFAPDFGAKAYAQENNNNNNTLILEDMRSIMRDQQRDITSINNMTSAEVESIKNMASAQLEALNDINTSSTKLASQGAYTALSVFFLGIGLVIFGLRLTTKSSPQIGRRFTMLVWALTLPVIVLIGLFQYGIITGNNLFELFSGADEPYFILTFLMYIPIAILLFLLFEQKGIVSAEAEDTDRKSKRDRIQEIEKLADLKERGLISEEEFQKLKAESLAKL